ncbi:AgmX/PglI C-terminal domain-containing protein [Pendulispora rubella]|uniref:AgmX/PglI C-terminal domain-containing protein n=1 Tax=Pendulispora rubella TaxID=2741070 RepID=A0ABZ2L3T0_9BACT
MAVATIPQHLRVSLTWGTTVLSVKTLALGQSFEPTEIPDGLEMSAVPVRGVPSGWEIDARGARSGFVRLRGRDEDALSIARSGVPIPIVPGDYGVLQYGLFALFFQYTDAPAKRIKGGWGVEALVLLAIFSSVVLHAGGIGLVRALTTPPPIAKPIELTSPEELAARFGLRRALQAEAAPSPSAADSGGASGVKDPGAHDKKSQGGGRKIAGTEGKFGKKGPSDRTELDGEVHPRANFGGLSEVLSSDTGEEIKRTLKTINTVSDALSGLNASNVQLGGGTGTNLKGTGGGGGGYAAAGTLFGAGTLNTGFGVGNGGGAGPGGGGAGGAGAGGRGPGGQGRGAGAGPGAGAGGGGGEARVASGGNVASHGGLSPEQVRRVVEAHMGALRACYESEAQRNPNLRGGLSVSWQIDPTGAVPSASVASTTLSNARVEGCVVRQVRAWKFPTNDSPTNVSYPFKFGVGG